MMQTALVISPQTNIISASPPVMDIIFFPDFQQARLVFENHLNSRASSSTTGLTRTSYNAYLDRFLCYLRKPDGTYKMPTLPVVQGYISHLLKTVSPTTAAIHLASVRRYLKGLSQQLCNPDDPRYLHWHEIRESVRNASEVANPPKQSESHNSPIQQHGCWLRINQLNEMLGLINRKTLQGKRDYALLITGLYTGLRRAELARLTLAHFDTASLVTDLIVGLQGKRNNLDDIPAPKQIYEAIMDYVRAFNAGLQDDDSRRITPTSTLWRQLTRSGRVMKAANQQLGQYGVARVVSRRYVDWRKSINPDYSLAADPKPFTAHDMRRSCVLNAYLAGMPPDQIIRITRHKSLDMFMKYLGKLIDYEKINLTDYGYKLA